MHGEAANILHSLEISEENYNCAWDMLNDRYDNQRIIIQKHIRAIYDLPDMTKESYSGLRQIVDGVSKHIRALTALNRPTDSWDDLLVFTISGKIDSTTSKE